MFDFARFTIQGRVGKVKAQDKLVRMSIAADASYREDGTWVKRTDWNEVIIFQPKLREWASNFKPGDYIRAEGRLRQNSYMRNGEKVYTVELIVEEIARQPVKKAEAEATSEAA